MPVLTINDFSFHFMDVGVGRPIVLLHGFPLDSAVWEAQIAGLCGQFRVIAPDLRGFGRSMPPAPFSIASLADDVHALLRKLDALPCVLGGLSMGGYVAQAFAKKYPTDLLGLMLIDTKSAGDTAAGKESRGKMIELVREKGSAAVADQMLPNMMADGRSRPEIAARLRQIMTSVSPLTIEHALVALRDRDDYTDCLPSIPVPTLLIVGEKDTISPPDVSRAMVAQIPRATLAIIADAGHMAPIERPERVNEAIKKFCQALPRQ